MPEQARYHSQLRFSWQKKAPKSGLLKTEGPALKTQLV